MRAIKRSIAQAREEHEAREREAREREAREREVREREARESREVCERPLRECPLDDGDTRHAPACDDGQPTCEHVTRELTTRIDTRPSAGAPARIDAQTRIDPRANVRSTAGPDALLARTTAAPASIASSRGAPPRRDVAPLRCEPCPRVIPARRLFDGSLLQQFRCDGTCSRDEQRAREKARAHQAQHARWEAARDASRNELRVQVAVTALLALLAAMWIVLAAREASAGPRPPAAREASSDVVAGSGRGTTRVDAGGVGDDGDGIDDDEAIDVAAPGTRELPFGAPVVAPPIGEVLAAAYRTAGLDRELGSGLVRRSRLAGLIPWLSVRTGRDTSWRDDNPDIARGVTVEVRATWRLDRLVFEGRELQVAAFEAARRRERRRLAARVIQVYFAWKRAARATGTQVRAASVAEEAAAELDDLTDGWFTEAREGQP